MTHNQPHARSHPQAQPQQPKRSAPLLEPGIFTPRPQRASVWRMAISQGRIESRLILSHGEQLLLNLVVPIAILVVAANFPLLGDKANLDHVVPMVFAVAACSAGFTGQAISLAFDRRYGALKRTGASGVPAWTIIAGKILGVLVLLLVQVVLLGTVAVVLGWHVSAAGAIAGLFTLLVGVATFTALGLLMGGTLSAEIVLALANLIWLVLMGVLGWVAFSGTLTDAGWFNAVPTVALASALTQALNLVFDPVAWVWLVAWMTAAVVAAVRWFRFDG